MQNTKRSKSLSATLASATFTASKLGATRSYEDILLLELLSRPDTLCYQLLSSHLGQIQIEQLRSQIGRIVSVPHTPTELSAAGVTPEIYYHDMAEAIAARYPDAERLSTIHALHFILSDTTTIASRALAMLGMTQATLDSAIADYTTTNDIAPLITFEQSFEMEKRTKERPHPLAKFGIDLTEQARIGAIDPVVGREREIERVVEILSRRKKNNPILVGEAGVGKSAIVEGLALRIVEGSVPTPLRNKRLFSLDVSSLVAGTKFRGEFEERMQQLLTAIESSRDSIIFIDEIHTIVGAGSTQGSLDTANILKPALARGEIEVIGATTTDEYRTNIESDSALDRRFQRVVVNPTSTDESIEILRRIAQHYEEHHRVIYDDEALVACVTLSERYIGDRHLPDKAIDLMDEAGARVATRRVDERVEIVKRGDIERVVTTTTGIPTEQISGDELRRLRGLENHLSSKVIGQPHAIERLSKRIRRSRTGLTDANRPIGVFLFAGSTGVGKTLLAKELARWIFGDDSRNLIRIDMSEYQERHTISRLIGSPPGYVGYGEGGELSEAVRRNPYSVVLLDEIEKAHPEIFNLMLQVFDEGRLHDGAGREINLRNTIIIMTSNVGSRSLATRHKPVGYATESREMQIAQGDEQHLHSSLESHFTPEFLNRIDEVILFRALNDEDMTRIVMIELESIFARFRSLGYSIRATNGALRELARVEHPTKYGARSLRRSLSQRVEEPLSELITEGLKRGTTIVVERNKRGEGIRLKVA
ncbi:MAG: ATP-dependent Clp protease ATP-binding subunit [Rikenellaceae bacterium]